MRPVPKLIRTTNVSLFNNQKYDPVTGCWNWTGCKIPSGYGQIRYGGKMILVHRLSAHFYLGFPLFSKLHILHSCDNPACFNPKHLSSGTQKENIHDAISRGRFEHRFFQREKTHCPKGHPYSGDNLRVSERNGSKRRTCRRCHLLETWKRRGKVAPNA